MGKTLVFDGTPSRLIKYLIHDSCVFSRLCGLSGDNQVADGARHRELVEAFSTWINERRCRQFAAGLRTQWGGAIRFHITAGSYDACFLLAWSIPEKSAKCTVSFGSPMINLKWSRELLIGSGADQPPKRLHFMFLRNSTGYLKSNSMGYLVFFSMKPSE